MNGALSPELSLSSTDFGLFGLPERFQLDHNELSRRWRDLQARLHPDRFASEGASSQRASMQWSVRLNEAYSRLRDPLKRAAYLCDLRGVSLDAERNTAMPAGFLVQQMQWREALDDAPTPQALLLLEDEVTRAWRRGIEKLTHLLDEQADPVAAAHEVRALMFIEKFRDDLQARLDTP